MLPSYLEEFAAYHGPDEFGPEFREWRFEHPPRRWEPLWLLAAAIGGLMIWLR